MSLFFYTPYIPGLVLGLVALIYGFPFSFWQMSLDSSVSGLTLSLLEYILVFYICPVYCLVMRFPLFDIPYP